MKRPRPKTPSSLDDLILDDQNRGPRRGREELAQPLNHRSDRLIPIDEHCGVIDGGHRLSVIRTLLRTGPAEGLHSSPETEPPRAIEEPRVGACVRGAKRQRRNKE